MQGEDKNSYMDVKRGDGMKEETKSWEEVQEEESRESLSPFKRARRRRMARGLRDN